MRHRRRMAVAALSLLVVAGCSGSSTDGSPPEELIVSAAASLADAFAAIGSAFEADNAGVELLLNMAGSSTLREQIIGGAPADVFASADAANMGRLVDAGLIQGEPKVFAGNVMQIAVPPGNPAGVTGLADFAEDDLVLGLCAAEVPCGALARQVLANAGVIPVLDTNEPDVRALLTKIASGELDAGITYLTDVVAMDGGVEGVPIPDDLNVTTEYPIAVVAGTAHPDLAGSFVEFVLSDGGRAILGRYGFTP